MKRAYWIIILLILITGRTTTAIAQENLVNTFQAGEGPVNEICFSNDSKTVATACTGKKSSIKLWSADSFEMISMIPADVSSIGFSNDDSMIVSCGIYNDVRIFSVATGKALKDFKSPTDKVHDLRFSPDGKYVASCGYLKIDIWSLENLVKYKTVKAHGGDVLGFSYTPDGTRMITIGEDNKIFLWDLKSRKILMKIEEFPERFICANSSSDEKNIVCAIENRISGSKVERSIRIRSTETGEIISEFPTDDIVLTKVTLNHDGSLCAGIDQRNQLFVWYSNNGDLLHSSEKSKIALTAVSFTRDGKKVFTGDETGLIRITQL